MADKTTAHHGGTRYTLKDGTRFAASRPEVKPELGQVTLFQGESVRLRGFSTHKSQRTGQTYWFEDAPFPRSIVGLYPVFQEQSGAWRMFTYGSKITHVEGV